jgi:Ser/Thr protein kinase RdoA (MazF antagonist)
MIGVLDRFEGELAVILVEEEKEEFTVDKKELPSGSEVNTLFNVTKENGNYRILEINKEATSKAQKKSANLMDQLRARSKGSKFKR